MSANASLTLIPSNRETETFQCLVCGRRKLQKGGPALGLAGSQAEIPVHLILSRKVLSMSMSQLQQTMATLRMTLAELQNKEQQLDTLIHQFRTQLQRLPRQVIYGRTPLDVSLSSMGEIEERLADTEATKRRLLAIKKTAQEELAALESVKQVDEAKRSLANLKRSMRLEGETLEGLAEVRRLEYFIAEHSRLAEQVITSRYQERHGG